MKNAFYIPESLDLPKLLEKKGLPSEFTKPATLDKFHYVLDNLYLRKILTKKSKWTDFRPVHSKVLESIVTPQLSAKIKKLLVELGVLEQNKNFLYEAGVRAMEYRFAKRFRGTRFRAVPISDKKIARRVEARQAEHRAHVVGENDGRELIARSIEGVECDFNAAEAYLKAREWESDYQKDAYDVCVKLFKNRDFYFTADERGRFYHLFTSLPRDLRSFFTYKGKRLHAIDVGNSQPLLLSSYYESESPECRRYQRIVENNGFYAYMNALLPEPFDLDDDEQKGALKELLFQDVFYGPNRKEESALMQVFRQEFPELYAQLWKAKIGEYRQLSLSLQRLEAELVIDTVASEFARQHRGKDVCLISVHDCLISTEEHVDELKEMLRREFRTRLKLDAPLAVKEFVRKTDSEDLALAA